MSAYIAQTSGEFGACTRAMTTFSARMAVGEVAGSRKNTSVSTPDSAISPAYMFFLPPTSRLTGAVTAKPTMLAIMPLLMNSAVSASLPT